MGGGGGGGGGLEGEMREIKKQWRALCAVGCATDTCALWYMHTLRRRKKGSLAVPQVEPLKVLEMVLTESLEPI